MTIRQRLFIKFYFHSFNATEAALKAYNAKNRQSAAVIGSRLLRNVNVKREIHVAFKAEGLTLESMIENLVEIAKATPDKVTANDVLRANIELLKLEGIYQ